MKTDFLHLLRLAGSLFLAMTALTEPAFAATSVSQFGITWTWKEDRPVGQFANGDWWVVGPVTITSITPASVEVSGWVKNGSMVNPTGSVDVQGFDSSIASGSQGMGWSAALNVSPNFTGTPLTLVPAGDLGYSLISTISRSTSVTERGTSSRPQVQTAAVLTVVSSAPAPGSFRPPACGTDKSIRWNKADLNYSILKNLPPVASTPTLTEVVGSVAGYWMVINEGSPARWIHPLDHMPEYGRDSARVLGLALLSLHLNYTKAEKEPLYIHLVQKGIDVWGALETGAVFLDLGGINHGWKAPLVLAAVGLDDTVLRQWADRSQRNVFQEDRQTWYVSQYDIGRELYTADGRPREQYITADLGMPEWGEQHTKQENRDGRNWNAYYRTIVSNSLVGSTLAMHLTTGATDAWKWPAFFDYMDRAFAIEKDDADNTTNEMTVFERDMWLMHRSSGNPPLVPPSPTSLILK